MKYKSQIAALQNALINSDSSEITSLIATARIDKISSATRIAAYADGYIERLLNATYVDYPTLAQYFGSEIKNIMRSYAKATNSTHWDLNTYSIAFAEYFKSKTQNQAAIELAELESAVTEVYYLPESDALESSQLAAIAPEDFANLKFTLRTASKLLKFNHKVNDYLLAFRNNEFADKIEEGAEYLCLVRHNNEIQRIILELPEYIMLNSIASGNDFNAAFEDALNHESGSMLQQNLPIYISRWLQNGIFANKI